MSKNLIIKNTFILYIQIIVTSIVSILSVRYVLDNLGQVDYGIFSVIGGILGFLMILSGALDAATQRYISFELGKNNIEKAKAYFNSSMGMYTILSIILLVLGILFENTVIEEFLTIPEERIYVAHIVYKLVLLNLVMTILSTPFKAVLNAREKMSVSAILSIIKSIALLLVTIYLYFTNTDKLLFYSTAITIISFCIFVAYIFIKNRLYEECSYEKSCIFSGVLIKEQLSFSGWSLFGAIAFIASNQGINVLLNIFFGPIINAAFAVSNKISAQLSIFSSTIMRASRPQIIKAEAANDRIKLHNLSFSSSKFSFFILFIIAFPIFLELPFILDVWLVDVPKHAVVFCSLLITTALINQITSSLVSVMLAVGKIALYQTVVGSIQISILPIGYILFIYGYEPESILIGSIGIAIIAGVARVIFIKYYAGMSIISWLREVPLKIFISILIPSIVTLYISTLFNEGWYKLFIIIALSIILNITFIYLLGMKKSEKQTLRDILKKTKSKLGKK